MKNGKGIFKSSDFCVSGQFENDYPSGVSSIKAPRMCFEGIISKNTLVKGSLKQVFSESSYY